jgi:hypothetical protein
MYVNNFDRVLQQAQASGTGLAVDLNGVQQLTVYVTGNGAVSAGAVQLETAPNSTYTGTWAALGAAVTVVANAVAVATIQACPKAIRARITTPVTGGTVTVQVVGN